MLIIRKQFKQNNVNAIYLFSCKRYIHTNERYINPFAKKATLSLNKVYAFYYIK